MLILQLLQLNLLEKLVELQLLEYIYLQLVEKEVEHHFLILEVMDGVEMEDQEVEDMEMV